ncbi:MAG: hypothetical protein QOJ35_300 [Solirubrobacteraceae bacterium]|nr:hypothetical protein [Solirubrobacteraceae bacterium]
MRMRAIACAITVTAAAGGALAPVAQTAVPKKKTVTCHFNVFIQSFPTATAPGLNFSVVRCSGPFGRGVQRDTFTLAPKTPTTGTAVLTFKAYFDTGTVSGVWRADYEFTSATSGTFKQKVTWSGGTGAFKHVRGTGSGTGLETGMRGTVDQRIAVTGL